MADEPLPKDVSTSFQRLVVAASNLNVVSDELGKPIETIDGALKRLNLGVATWVEFNDLERGGGWHEFSDLGYAKVGQKWGIALRTREGHDFEEPSEHKIEEWLFNDAPRRLRIRAVDHLPELLDALTEATNKTAVKLRAKIGQVQQVVAAMGSVAAPTTQRRK